MTAGGVGSGDGGGAGDAGFTICATGFATGLAATGFGATFDVGFDAAGFSPGAAPAAARKSASSSADSARGVCNDIPSAPAAAVRPLPFANRSWSFRWVTSVMATVLAAACHPSSPSLGCSSTATSHSASFGGRTVTANSAPPSPSGASALWVLP